MKKKAASVETVERIRKLAEEPGSVRLTEKAKWGLMGSSLTKLGLCNEIANWIASGEVLRETTTTEPPEHSGKVVYFLKPRIDKVLYYIRLGIEEYGSGNERLLVISMHPDV